MKKRIILGIALIAHATCTMDQKPSPEECAQRAEEYIELLAHKENEVESSFFTNFCKQLHEIDPIISCKSYTVEPEEAKQRMDKIWEVIRSSSAPCCTAALNHPTLNADEKYAACYWVMHLTARAGKYLEQLPVQQ